MKMSEMFPSKYLAASDVEPSKIVTVREVALEMMQRQDSDDEQKPVVYFEEFEKGMVLNKTNGTSITELTGSDDTDKWPGHQVQLYSMMVDAFGKTMPAIRIKPAPVRKADTATPVSDKDRFKAFCVNEGIVKPTVVVAFPDGVSAWMAADEKRTIQDAMQRVKAEHEKLHPPKSDPLDDIVF